MLSSAEPRAERRRAARKWLALAALALLVRGVAFELAAPVRLVGDEYNYVNTAVQIAAGNGHWNPRRAAYAGWPPGQAWLLSLFVAGENPPLTVDPASLAPLQRACVLLGSALPLLVVLLGRALFGARTGWIAGVIAALYPEFISFSHYLLAEGTFAILLTAALWLAVRARTGGIGWVVAAGVGFGAAALTREEGFLIAGVCGSWWWLTSRPRAPAAARAVLLVAVMIATVAPWSVRNQRVLGRFVPVSLSGWMGAMEGNLAGQPWLRPDNARVKALRDRYNALPDEVQRLDFSRSEALRGIAAEQPQWLAKKLARNLPPMLAPDSFVLRKLTLGAYGDPDLAFRRGIFLATAGAYLAVAALALLGAAASDRERRSLLLLSLAAVLAVHVIANASSRYRLPLMPLVIVYAGHALSRGSGIWSGLGARARIGVGLAGLALVASAALFAPEALEFWNHGGFADRLRQ